MRCFRMGDFGLRWLEDKKEAILLSLSSPFYRSLLLSVFPYLSIGQPFLSKDSYFEWGMYISNLPQTDLPVIHSFLRLLQTVLYIDDELDACYALAHHMSYSEMGELKRSSVGQMVYEAKPYHRPSTLWRRYKARRLARRMHEFLGRHPTLANVDWIVGVPSSHPNLKFSLPVYLCGLLAKWNQLNNGSRLIRKQRITPPMKDIYTLPEKENAIRGAFEVTDKKAFAGKSVLLIDDLYQTGSTLAEIGKTLRSCGAASVVGFCAVKTQWDG